MADNKKTYSIVINGVKETTDAVKSLNDALTQLDEKIDGLQNEHINIANRNHCQNCQNRHGNC